jgi:hypothetical protein
MTCARPWRISFNILSLCHPPVAGHILLSLLRLPRPGRPCSRIYMWQEQGGPVIPPGTGFPCVASHDSQGYGGGILTCLHTGLHYSRFWFLLCSPGPPLWSSGQSSWLQIQRSGFDSQPYQIFCEVVGLERGPLRLVSTTEELLERKISGSGLENRDYGLRGSAALITRYPSICKGW